MKKYTFKNGDVVTSELEAKEPIKRMTRLDALRVMTEQYECEEGQSICKKALRAYNKMKGFTGIIRLTSIEKDWLSYQLENSCITEEEVECIKFYCRMEV